MRIRCSWGSGTRYPEGVESARGGGARRRRARRVARPGTRAATGRRARRRGRRRRAKGSASRHTRSRTRSERLLGRQGGRRGLWCIEDAPSRLLLGAHGTWRKPRPSRVERDRRSGGQPEGCPEGRATSRTWSVSEKLSKASLEGCNSPEGWRVGMARSRRRTRPEGRGDEGCRPRSAALRRSRSALHADRVSGPP